MAKLAGKVLESGVFVLWLVDGITLYEANFVNMRAIRLECKCKYVVRTKHQSGETFTVSGWVPYGIPRYTWISK